MARAKAVGLAVCPRPGHRSSKTRYAMNERQLFLPQRSWWSRSMGCCTCRRWRLTMSTVGSPQSFAAARA